MPGPKTVLAWLHVSYKLAVTPNREANPLKRAGFRGRQAPPFPVSTLHKLQMSGHAPPTLGLLTVISDCVLSGIDIATFQGINN